LSGRIPTPLVAILLSLLALAICGGCDRASGEQLTGGPENDRRAVARAGDVEAIGGRIAGGKGGAVARAGDVVARAGGVGIRKIGNGAVRPGGEQNAREATLEIGGAPGTGFSGACAVGGEERAFRGQVPERFVYELDGRRLECEIRKQSAGAMKITLDAGGSDFVQRAGSRRVAVRIVYSKGGISSSIQSFSTSSGSTSQTIISSSSQVVSSSSTNLR
jgi:hypothetical protein